MYYTHLYGEIRKSIILLYMVFGLTQWFREKFFIGACGGKCYKIKTGRDGSHALAQHETLNIIQLRWLNAGPSSAIVVEQ